MDSSRVWKTYFVYAVAKKREKSTEFERHVWLTPILLHKKRRFRRRRKKKELVNVYQNMLY